MANEFDQFDTPTTETTNAPVQGAIPTSGSKWSALNSQYDSKYGLQTGFLDALGGHESGNDIKAHNKGSSAYGQFQMTNAAWKDTGIDPTSKAVNNPNVQADSAAKYFSNILNNKANGDYELALRMYFQGAGASKEKLYSKEANAYVNDPRFKPFLNKQQQPQGEQTNPFDQFDNQQANAFDQFDNLSDNGSTEQPQEAPQAPQGDGTQGAWTSSLGSVIQPTARALTGAAVDIANIPSELADMSASTLSWLGNKVGIGDGTYRPAPRVTTGDVEQGLGLEKGSLTPQTGLEKAGEAIAPFLTGSGEARAAISGASKVEKVVGSLVNSLADSAFGSLANNSKTDSDSLASDLAINTLGGAIFNKVGSVAKEAIIGSKKGLTKLSEDVATSIKAKELKADMHKKANDLTSADIEYNMALDRNAPEKELNEYRSKYLNADEAYNAAEAKFKSHLDTSPKGLNDIQSDVNKMTTANTKGADYSLTDVDQDLLTKYGIRPRMSENINKGKGKLASRYVAHKAIHALGLSHGLMGYAAAKTATKGLDALTNSIANRAGRKGLTDLHSALQGTYNPGADLGYQEMLLNGGTGLVRPALMGGFETVQQ